MFDFVKNVKIVSVDKEKVGVIASAFKLKASVLALIILLSLSISISYMTSNYVMIRKQNIIQMDIEQLNEYINEDKANLVYNYIKDNGLQRYEELEDINGIGLKTIQKLEKFTYIKGVD